VISILPIALVRLIRPKAPSGRKEFDYPIGGPTSWQWFPSRSKNVATRPPHGSLRGNAHKLDSLRLKSLLLSGDVAYREAQ